MVEPAMFRDVLAQWPSGVTVVTTLVDGSWHGMTASSFSSVSLEPAAGLHLPGPLALHPRADLARAASSASACWPRTRPTWPGGSPGWSAASTDRFLGETWSVAGTGTPLLDSALGWVDCRVVHEHPGGDHTIFVGEVVAAHTARRTAPLLFHSRGWGQFADVLPDVATLSDGGLVSTLVGRGEADPWIARTAKRVRESGVRVRVLDLTGDAARDAGRRSRRLGDGHNSSALVDSAPAAERGAGPGRPHRRGVRRPRGRRLGGARRRDPRRRPGSGGGDPPGRLPPGAPGDGARGRRGLRRPGCQRDLPPGHAGDGNTAGGASHPPGGGRAGPAGAAPRGPARCRPARPGQGAHRPQERRPPLRHHPRRASTVRLPPRTWCACSAPSTSRPPSTRRRSRESPAGCVNDSTAHPTCPGRHPIATRRLRAARRAPRGSPTP